MAGPNPDVMSMVEKELRKNPDAPTQELFEKAQQIDPTVAELNIRQFFARYPLQVKRRQPETRRERKAEAATGATERRPRRRRARRTQETGADRDAIRGVLLQFAKNIVAADDKAAVVDIIGDVDRYVDRIVKAAGAS